MISRIIVIGIKTAAIVTIVKYTQDAIVKITKSA